MDLQEWELLPDDGFLEIHDDGGKKFFSRKYGGESRKNIFNTNYFICPSPKSSNPHVNQRVPQNQSVRVPIQLVQTTSDSALDDELGKEVMIPNVPIDQEANKVITEVPIDQEVKADNNTGATLESDCETVSQVFFKKMEESEFVDMKMNSPMSSSSSSSRGIVPQIDAVKFQFEEERKIEKESNIFKKTNLDSDSSNEEGLNNWEDKNGGLKLWKWSLTGIGAICSFGVAAATICIIICGTHQKNKQQQDQKLQFQIYADNKRIDEVVHHANKLNEAISAARGVPLNKAEITIGGYFDGI